jgi:uncharacterized protein YciI
MSLFVITYTHPDPAGWKKHLAAHLDWLVVGVESDRLRASGDTRQTPIRSALMVVAATDRESAAAFIATDPFVTEGLVGEMTITEWNPLFGAFNSDSDMAGKTAREVVAFFLLAVVKVCHWQPANRLTSRRSQLWIVRPFLTLHKI